MNLQGHLLMWVTRVEQGLGDVLCLYGSPVAGGHGFGSDTEEGYEYEC